MGSQKYFLDLCPLVTDTHLSEGDTQGILLLFIKIWVNPSENVSRKKMLLC